MSANLSGSSQIKVIVRNVPDIEAFISNNALITGSNTTLSDSDGIKIMISEEPDIQVLFNPSVQYPFGGISTLSASYALSSSNASTASFVDFDTVVLSSSHAEWSDNAMTSSYASNVEWTYITNIPIGIISSSQQVSYTGLINIPVGVVSSSGQILYSELSNIPVGIISSSGQVSYTGLINIPDGVVSSSNQVSYIGLSGIPNGIVSSSIQINTGSYSGSFIGTSSWANSSSLSISSSYSITASYAIGAAFDATINRGYSGSFTGSISGSVFGTSSWSNNSISSSYAPVSAYNVSAGTFPGAMYGYAGTVVLPGDASVRLLFGAAASQSGAGLRYYGTAGLAVRNGDDSNFASLAIKDITGSSGIFTGTLSISNVFYSSSVFTTVNGNNIVASLSTSSYDAVYFDYIIKSGSNARAGTITSVWNSVLLSYTETSTTDIGDTSGLTFGMNISSNNIQLHATSSTDGWSVKTIIRAQ